MCQLALLQISTLGSRPNGSQIAGGCCLRLQVTTDFRAVNSKVLCRMADSLFSPSTEEEEEEQRITVTESKEIIDFEDDRYLSSQCQTVSLPLTAVPKVKAKAVLACVSAPRLVAFNRAKPWLETMDQGASTVLIVGERSKVITVSKTGEYQKPPTSDGVRLAAASTGASEKAPADAAESSSGKELSPGHSEDPHEGQAGDYDDFEGPERVRGEPFVMVYLE